MPDITLPPGYKLDLKPQVPAGYTLDKPQELLPENPQPQGSPLGRLWDSFASRVNVIPAFQEWLNRGDRNKALMDAMHAGMKAHREGRQPTPEEQTLIDKGMSAQIGGQEVQAPMGMEGLHVAGQQVAQGDLAGATGTVLGDAVAFTAPAAIARALPAKIGLPVRLNPVEQAAIEFADRKNIPLSVSHRTGGRPARGMEAILENDLGGSNYAANARRATTEAVQRVGTELADQIHPESMTSEGAGLAVESKLTGTIQDRAKLANQHYSKAWEAERNPANVRNVIVRDKDGGAIIGEDGKPMTERMPLPVDMSAIKDALLPIYERYKYTLPETDVRASKGLKAIRNIIEGGDFKPASAAELDLSMLKDASRAEMPELRDISQGMAAAAVKELDQQIRGVMGDARMPGYDPKSGAPNPALDALLKGRKATAEKWDVADTLKSLGRVDSLEPVNVYEKLTVDRDARVERLRQVAQYAPEELPKVGRAYVEGLIDTATRGGNFEHTQKILNSWEDIGPETKKLLFKHPGLISDLDNFFRLARKVAFDPNPSGSAKVAAIGTHVTNILTGAGVAISHPGAGAAIGLGGEAMHIIGAAGMSRLLFSPKAARLLVEGMRIPADSVRGAAIAAQLVKLAGDDAKPLQQSDTGQ